MLPAVPEWVAGLVLHSLRLKVQIRNVDSKYAQMIKRGFHERLAYLLSRFPGVTVLGPRQCGKTTFIREALSGWTYLDLERRSDATPLEADAEARLMMLGDSVIFDEAQRVP